MDDFTINVRQISQYPQNPVGPNDLVLIQQGGLGGPYASATVAGLVQGALNAGPLVSPGQIFAANFVLPADGVLNWNGVGALAFSPGTGFTFSYATPDFASPLLQIRPDGSAQLPFNTLQVARDPLEPFEVATKNFWQNNTVASFNGRIGAVTLNNADLVATLGGQPATQEWVNATLCSSIPEFIYSNPFVYTFNGRVGDITLSLADIAQANFSQPGSYPIAPNPALGDASNRIATTMFVDESLEEWASEINSNWNAADFELLNILQTQYAPINSPAFTGNPTAPTPSAISNDASIATTAFVMHAVTSSVTGVVSWNGRTGAVNMTAADVNNVGGALLNSPTFLGTPTVPLPPAADNSAQIASTAWVQQEIAAVSAGVTSWNGRSGIVNMQAADITLAGGALLNSPNFTGTPSAPTAAVGTNTAQIATTAFVMANVGVASFNGRTGAVSFQANDISAVGGALLASPTFTGTPAGPTAAPGTSTTQLATTAFVINALTSASIVSSFNTRTGAVTLTLADVTNVGGAPIASPAFTGTPTAPQPVTTDVSANVSTTKFVTDNDITRARGFTNKIRNGTFAIWQRATPINVVNTGAYTADGWIVVANAGNVTATVVGNNRLVGSSLQVTTNSGNLQAITQRIESFLAMGLTGVGGGLAPIGVQLAIYNGMTTTITPTCTLSSPTATDNFVTVTTMGAVTCSPIPPSQVGIACGVIVPTAGNVMLGLQVDWSFAGQTTGGFVQVTQADVRAVSGFAATGIVPASSVWEPELRDPAEELILCRRYFQWLRAFSASGSTPGYAGWSYSLWNTPTMRIEPTAAVVNWNGGQNVSTFNAYPQSADQTTVQLLTPGTGTFTGNWDLQLFAEL